MNTLIIKSNTDFTSVFEKKLSSLYITELSKPMIKTILYMYDSLKPSHGYFNDNKVKLYMYDPSKLQLNGS